MSKDYNLLANYIVSKYSERISGRDIEDFLVGEDPSKRVMVGMLAENRVESSLVGGYRENSETRFESVPSLSLSFEVSKGSVGSIHIVPRGLLFFSVEPNYEMTLQYIIQRFSEKDRCKYSSIEELCKKYADLKIPLPKTYKVIDIEDYIDDGIELDCKELSAGKRNLQNEIGEKLDKLASDISNLVRIVPDIKISFFDLQSEERFKLLTASKEEATYPHWDIDILCTIAEDTDAHRIMLQMVNNTIVQSHTDAGYVPRIFDAGIRVKGDQGVLFKEIELDYFKNSYKEREPVFAIAENTSAVFIRENNEILTDNIPTFFQKRLRTKDQFNEYITFDKLINDPIANLTFIHEEMKKDYEKCVEELHMSSFQSESAKEKFKRDLDIYKQEIDRFERGIKQIEYKDWVKKAFLCMNKTFQTELDGEHRNIKGWRLFQIVFIVSMICEMIRSEYKDDNTLVHTDIEVANLLYFPTGGGKTEAFLGCCVFAMFFDRFRGKEFGITSIIKYPLRLLAVQQLDRILSVVMKANTVKEQCSEIADRNLFEVGFFVGKSNTPNNISSKEPLSDRGHYVGKGLIIDSDADTLNDYYRFIDTCPICGKRQVNVRFDREKWKLEHHCDNSDCKADVLPLLIVDNEIYRTLPSIVVSTIDKMAMLGTTNEFKMLLGQVKYRCPVHGFTCQSKCLVKKEGCTHELIKVDSLKDPIPTMLIQDEMHLVNESLGTFDAHYESFINYYAKNLVEPEQRKQVRFIGATATISMYEEHIKHLYHMGGRRFPCEYPSIESGSDFYSYTDNNDVTRILLGYAPYGRSITNGMWESVYIMRNVLFSLFQALDETHEELSNMGFEGDVDDLQNMILNYWIELVYNNRKQDAMELENSFQNQGNNMLEEKGVPKFNIKQMTSDVDFQSVRKVLFDIQSNKGDLESTNLLLATSTISHGVDEDAFNIMFFFGMPNKNAEYIQAYSRTGRKYTGIVIDIIRLARIRDRSYLKNFVIFHQNKDELVEAVPINRWAKNAIYSTLPGIFSAMLMQYYTIKNDIDSLYYAVDLKKMIIDGKIKESEIIEHIIGAYACSDTEKMSVAYINTITKEVHNLLEGIANGNFTKDCFISDAIAKFSHGKKRPMTSLRDTEEQIEIRIR